MNLNPVVPGIFNFTTITIASGSTLKFSENKYHGPVYFLASGDVAISSSGTLDLSGDQGGAFSSSVQRIPNAAGSGGFSGGMGGFNSNPLAGNGPGGGIVGGPGITVRGTNTSNTFLVPLIGGSGGAGAGNCTGSAGGGALLIASSTTITVNGTIDVHGGWACNPGAGGSVRLVATQLGGTGGVEVASGNGDPCGIARFESNNLGALNVASVCPRNLSLPYALNLPATPTPSIKVTSINGVPINSNPFSFPDIAINTTTQVPVTIQAQYVPVGTMAKIYVFSEIGADQVINIGPLTGTDLTSTTATANIIYPAGASRGFVKATW